MQEKTSSFLANLLKLSQFVLIILLNLSMKITCFQIINTKKNLSFYLLPLPFLAIKIKGNKIAVGIIVNNSISSLIDKDGKR